jgi:hypothetical protein
LDLFVLDRAPAASLPLTPSFPATNLSPPLPSSSMSPTAALQAAIMTGNIVALGRLLSIHRINVNEPIGGDVLLLHYAVECGNEGRFVLVLFMTDVDLYLAGSRLVLCMVRHSCWNFQLTIFVFCR